jgi:Phage tail assembly chaperone protein, TAC
METTFASGAALLCGHAALLLGWRPHEFWSSTPAELACIMSAMTPQASAPLNDATLTQLKEQFPDG